MKFNICIVKYCRILVTNVTKQHIRFFIEIQRILRTFFINVMAY